MNSLTVVETQKQFHGAKSKVSGGVVLSEFVSLPFPVSRTASLDSGFISPSSEPEAKHLQISVAITYYLLPSTSNVPLHLFYKSLE